jgi:hypothetical protein
MYYTVVSGILQSGKNVIAGIGPAEQKSGKSGTTFLEIKKIV